MSEAPDGLRRHGEWQWRFGDTAINALTSTLVRPHECRHDRHEDEPENRDQEEDGVALRGIVPAARMQASRSKGHLTQRQQNRRGPERNLGLQRALAEKPPPLLRSLLPSYHG